MTARLNKLERDVDILPQYFADQLQVGNNGTNIQLDRKEAESSYSASNNIDKKKNKSKKTRSGLAETEVGVTVLEGLREEFNLKLQALMEEIQNSVTFKDFDKKCAYFEERMNLLKTMIPSYQSIGASAGVVPAPVLERLSQSAGGGDRVFRERLNKLEDQTNHLKIHFEQLLNLFEKGRVGKARTNGSPHSEHGQREVIQSLNIGDSALKKSSQNNLKAWSQGTEYIGEGLNSVHNQKLSLNYLNQLEQGLKSSTQLSGQFNTHFDEDEMDIERQGENQLVLSSRENQKEVAKPPTGEKKGKKKQKSVNTYGSTGKIGKPRTTIESLSAEEVTSRGQEKNNPLSSKDNRAQSIRLEEGLGLDNTTGEQQKKYKSNKEKIRSLLGKTSTNTLKK